MDKGITSAVALAGGLVNHLAAFFQQFGYFCLDVRHLETDMMQARAALLQISGGAAVIRGRLDEFKANIPQIQKGDFDLFGGDGLRLTRDGQADVIAPEAKRFIKVSDDKGEVIEPDGGHG